MARVIQFPDLGTFFAEEEKQRKRDEEIDELTAEVAKLEAESIELLKERDLLRSQKEAARFQHECLRFEKLDLLACLSKQKI